MAKKRYFSSAEKKQIIVAAAAVNNLEGTIEALAQRGREKEVLKLLRTAKTYLDKAVEAWIAVTPAAEGDALVELSTHYNLVLTLKSEMRQQRQQALQDASKIPVDVEDMEDLAEAAVFECMQCNGTCKDECKLYKVFSKYEVAPYNLEDGSLCPYAYKE